MYIHIQHNYKLKQLLSCVVIAAKRPVIFEPATLELIQYIDFFFNAAASSSILGACNWSCLWFCLEHRVLFITDILQRPFNLWRFSHAVHLGASWLRWWTAKKCDGIEWPPAADGGHSSYSIHNPFAGATFRTPSICINQLLTARFTNEPRRISAAPLGAGYFPNAIACEPNQCQVILDSS